MVDSSTSIQSPSNNALGTLKSPTSRTYTGNNFPRTQVKKLNKHYRKSVLQDSISQTRKNGAASIVSKNSIYSQERTASVIRRENAIEDADLARIRGNSASFGPEGQNEAVIVIPLLEPLDLAVVHEFS
jgi:hypothetical protein